MHSLEYDDGPKKSEAPDIVDMVEEPGLDEIFGSNEPVQGGKRRGFVVFRDPGSGVSGSGHCGR